MEYYFAMERPQPTEMNNAAKMIMVNAMNDISCRIKQPAANSHEIERYTRCLVDMYNALRNDGDDCNDLVRIENERLWALVTDEYHRISGFTDTKEWISTVDGRERCLAALENHPKRIHRGSAIGAPPL